MAFLMGLLLDVVLSFFIASLAQSKGRSFGFWFIVSIVFDPIIGLLMLLLIMAIAKLFGSSEPVKDQERPIINVTASSESERLNPVTPEELYRQSEKLFQQAVKLREAADQLNGNKDQDTGFRRIGTRS